jgi:hypothetical protein
MFAVEDLFTLYKLFVKVDMSLNDKIPSGTYTVFQAFPALLRTLSHSVARFKTLETF